MSILAVRQLSKNYGRIKALHKLSFEVPKGAVYGILGPNGSGKTTMLSLVTDILRPTEGSIQLFGETPTEQHRKKIGTLLETPNFYHYLTATQNLAINAQIKGRGADDIDRVLEMVNLQQWKDVPFNKYSLGMKQRLAIASVLLGDPEVLILDEPTNGLDPVGIAEIRNLISMLAKKGITIILASHMLDEVQKVCTHVLILKKGNTVANGSVHDILRHDDIFQMASSDLDALKILIKSHPDLLSLEDADDHVLATFAEGKVKSQDLNRYCFDKGLVLSQLSQKRARLETKFLELTNN